MSQLVENLLIDTTDQHNFTQKKYRYLCRLGARKTSESMILLAGSDAGLLHESTLYEYQTSERTLELRQEKVKEEDPSLPGVYYTQKVVTAYLFSHEKLRTWIDTEICKGCIYSFWSLNLGRITDKGRIEKTLHATLMIFDHEVRSVYFMDPNGNQTSYAGKIDDLLEGYFRNSDYLYIRSTDWSSYRQLQSNYKDKFDNGNCVSWCFLFVVWMISKKLKPAEAYKTISEIDDMERAFLIYRFNNNLYRLLRGKDDDSDLDFSDSETETEESDDEESEKKPPPNKKPRIKNHLMERVMVEVIDF